MSETSIETISTQEYQIRLNRGTQLGELWVGKYVGKLGIPLDEKQCKLLSDADEDTRRTLVVEMMRAQDARIAGRKRA